MTINSKELQRLAVLVNKTVHSLEFPEEFRFDAHAENALSFLDTMEAKHANNEMLTSIRSAIIGIPQNKLLFFKVALDLFAKINVTENTEEVTSDFGLVMMPPVTAGATMQMSV